VTQKKFDADTIRNYARLANKMLTIYEVGGIIMIFARFLCFHKVFMAHVVQTLLFPLLIVHNNIYYTANANFSNSGQIHI
jgi:hypothetical protein